MIWAKPVMWKRVSNKSEAVIRVVLSLKEFGVGSGGQGVGKSMKKRG